MNMLSAKRTISTTLAGTMLALSMAACGDSGAQPTPSAPPVETATNLVVEPTNEPTESTSDGWSTFTSKADGFSIDMPGEPRTSSQSSDSALGEITFHFFQVADGPAQYVASYNDYPVSETDLSSPDLLQDAIQGAAQGAGVENMQTVDVQGFSAIEGEMTAQDTTHVWYRGVLVKNRLYQLIVSSPESDKEQYDDSAHRFIESFLLLNE